MEIFLFILIFFLLIIILVLFTPIKIVLSTKKGMVGLSYGTLFSMGLKLLGDDLKFYYNLPFRKREIDVIEKMASNKVRARTIEQPEKNRKESKGWSKALWNRFKKRWKEVLNAFQVKELNLNIDTDDYILNAYLFPIFQYLGYKTHQTLAINFLGINKIELRVRTRLADLLYALLK